MRVHLRRIVCVAALLCLATGMGGRGEAGVLLQTPAGLNPGDSFRFVFVSDGTRNATSTNIADYDGYVNAQAGGATYDGVVVNWLAIASTGAVDAIDHIGQAAVPVYLSDGTLATTSTTPAGLWSGAILHAINLDLAGNPVSPFDFVWTGTNPFGTGLGGPLGASRPQTGSTTDTNGAWVSSGTSPGGDIRRLYGISSVLIVPRSGASAPEPSALVMLATGLAAGWTCRNPRRRRPVAPSGTTE